MTGPAPRRALAELFGTALLMIIGTGTIVAGERAAYLPTWILAIAWTFAVLVPVLLFARSSGAHLNPAVTTALAASGRIAWREWPFYVSGQLAGAFLGTFVVLATLGRGVRDGATVPASGYVDYVLPAEVALTALLVATVFVVADRGEGRYRWRLLLPALAVGAATFLLGPLTGISLNPARSIAPAVVSGVYDDLWIYLIAQPVAALVMAGVWRARSVDRSSRGVGRVDDRR